MVVVSNFTFKVLLGSLQGKRVDGSPEGWMNNETLET